jgi:hypothetical protein
VPGVASHLLGGALHQDKRVRTAARGGRRTPVLTAELRG